MNKAKWLAAKQKGSTHYKTGTIEPVDLYANIRPHVSLSGMEIFSLLCIIKYAFRQATTGLTSKDLGKIAHYVDFLDASLTADTAKEGE